MLNQTLIATAMQARGLNQSGLAQLCNVTREAVSNWMNGESIPRPAKLRALADALDVPVDALVAEDVSIEPVIAYRTRKKAPVTGEAAEAATDVAFALAQLVPHLSLPTLFRRSVLESPNANDSYICEAAAQARRAFGVGVTEAVSREMLVYMHRRAASVLVPVLWAGDKEGHENALSVFLPQVNVSFVVVSLNAHNDDFNYWLAHELGHSYSIHALQGDVGEHFAERFAQELLFPVSVAGNAYAEIQTTSHPMEHVWRFAGRYEVSPVTVIRQMDRFAREHGVAETGLETAEFWSAWQESRATMPSVVETLLGNKSPSLTEFVFRTEDYFKTPIYEALARWQRAEGGRSPSFIATAFNIDITTAFELSHILQGHRA